MAVQFENYEYKFRRNGKYYFSPNKLGKRIGKDIKDKVESKYRFDDFVFHLEAKGGHVAAMHLHREHRFFSRIDISNFFYSVARNRVQRSLREIGIVRSRHYAKWSCVRNPFHNPRYSLPHGFIQSPILASLVLMLSPVGVFLRKISAEGIVAPSVYMDDIALSSDNLDELVSAFDELKMALEEANFQLNEEKVRTPSEAIDLFNCDLSCGQTTVQQERIDRFYESQRSPASISGFDDYCERVSTGNR